MISDLYADDALAAVNDAVRNPRPMPPAPRRTSIWQDIGNFATAVPRGVSEAVVQVGATISDAAQAMRYMRDATPEQRKAMDRGGVPAEQFSSEAGDTLRDFGRMYRPDAETAHWSEQVLYGFARGATKIVTGAAAAGPAGVLAAGVEEGVTQSDELRLQGVDLGTRMQAGGVQGAGLALAALPMVGTTVGQTAALYVAGGPGGFMAQQALTRKILQDAGHDKLGEQFDPFDPVGLAVASLVPAGFAAYGMRAQRLQRAAASLPTDMRDLPGGRPVAPEAAPAEPFPGQRTATAQAARDYTQGPAIPQDVVDAAMVTQLVHTRRASNPVADAGDLRAGYAHEAALAKAEEQIAAGERVSVGDVAPAAGAAPDSNFAARLDAAIAERGYTVSFGSRSEAAGTAGARTIVLADMPEAEFMAKHGNSVTDVKAHEFAHAWWAGATATPNFRDPANKALLSDLRSVSREFRPFVWDNHKAHANKPGELLADGLAFWAKHPERRAEFPALDKLVRGYDAGGLVRQFPDLPATSPTDPITTFATNLRELSRTLDEERAAMDAPARDAAAAPAADAAPAQPAEPAPMRLADPAPAADAPVKPELPIDAAATERLVVSLRKRESVLNKLLECMA